MTDNEMEEKINELLTITKDIYEILPKIGRNYTEIEYNLLKIINTKLK